MDTTVKYLNIAQDLTDKIKHDLYPAGTLLPSEADLTKLYGTSRATIRKALTELTNNGLIQKIKGKGSVVLNTARFTFPISGITTFSELNESQQMHATTKVLTLAAGTLPQDIIDQTQVKDPRVTFVQRLRTINEEPIVVDEDYILKSVVKNIPEKVAEHSLYRYFEETLGLEIAYATKTITVEPVSDKMCQFLGLGATNNLAVVVRSLTYLNDTTFFQYTVSRHRPDRFKFVDFARRHHHGQ